MASKRDAPLRRAEPVAASPQQRPEHDDSSERLEPHSADAGASKLLHATLAKSPRTPPPARQKRSPPPLKRTMRSLSDVGDRRVANAPPLPLDDDDGGDRDARLAQFRARLERGEFFAPRRRRAAAPPSQTA